MSIYAKVAKLRATIATTQMAKSGFNKFGGWNYFELGDFLPHALKACADIGVCPIITFTEELATMRVCDTESEEFFLIEAPMREAGVKGALPIQNLGATETYQRRYLWMLLLELTENDVVDSVNQKEQAPQASEPKAEQPREIASNQNSTKTQPTSPTTRVREVWEKLCFHYGYDKAIKDTMDPAMEQAKKILKERYNVTSAKNLNANQIEDLDKWIDSESVPKGPESFEEEENIIF